MRALFRWFCLFAVLFCCSFAFGQEVRGTVCDAKSQEKLPGAIVILKLEGKVLGYRTTDAEGTFSFPQCPSGAVLEARLMGYKLYVGPAEARQHLIQLEAEHTVIEAAVVRADKVTVRGDTVSYNIPALTNPADRTLHDLLKRIPGIEVSDKGYVRYNGKPINKFYVEGNDVLDSRYNLVVGNLSPEAITTLQIFEHHQPVKALEGLVRSESAALNIILHEKVRGQWMTAAELGGGFDGEGGFPVSVDLFLSRLSRKTQMMATAKYDVSGRNIIRNADGFHPEEVVFDLNDVDFLNRFRPADYVLAYPGTESPLGYEREAFNRSVSSSVYSKSALRSDRSMTISADYERERLLHDSRIRQYFFDEQGTPQLDIEELSSGKQRTRLPSLELRYTRNDTTTFLNDHLRIRNKHAAYRAGETGENKLNQQMGQDELEILNAISVIRRNKRNEARSFSMLSQYTDKEERMRIEEEPGVSPDGALFSQQVRARLFFNRMDFVLSRKLARDWTLDAYTLLPVLLRQFHSELDGPGLSSDNGFRLFSFRPSEEVRIQYRKGRFRLTGQSCLTVPLIFCSLKERNLSHLTAVTSVSGAWQLSPKWAAELSVSHDSGSIDEQALYPLPIMQGYRRLASEPVMKPNPGFFSGKASINGQHPIAGLSFRASVLLQRGKRWGFERELSEETGFTRTWKTDEKVPFALTTASFQLDKAFLGFQHVLSVRVEGSRYTASLKQDGILSMYDMDQASAFVKWTGTFSDKLTVNWQEQLNFNRIRIGETLTDSGIWRVSQKASAVFAPISWLQIENVLDGCWNTVSRNVVCFWDIHLDVPIRKVRLGLHFNNILNHRTYRNSIESPLSRIDYMQPLRPFSALLRLSVNL